GHATLASAHVLWERAGTGGRIDFHTRSGKLSAERAEGGWIVLDFPATPPKVAEPPAGLLGAMGLELSDARTVARSRFDWMIELDSPDRVRAARPDLAQLRGVEARGVMLTAKGDGREPYDFVSRFFAPRSGVD